jgi:cytidylate kinase
VAAVPEVREALVAAQRRLGAAGGVVMDGRDVGTCVFPDAEYKFFVTATQEERVDRRYRELARRGAHVTRQAVARELAERDRQDRERDVAPLSPAPDAILLDTTGLTVEDVVARVLAVVGASAHGAVPSPAPVG